MHACTVQYTVADSAVSSNGGLATKIGFVLGQSWMVIPMNKHSPVMRKCLSPLLIENAVVYMKSTLFTNSYVQNSSVSVIS